MEFRPCIDIHNGQVKQIVGSSLRDQGNRAVENFVSSKPASYYAGLYRDHGLKGGHVILLNGQDSPYYPENRKQAMEALKAYPGGLQIGGGITAENAQDYIQKGASHVIVSSYVFKGGEILWDRLIALKKAVGSDRIVLDLSCKKSEDAYYITTDRWQTLTRIPVNADTLKDLEEYCDEFLIHAVDAEGKSGGIETELVKTLAKYKGKPVTYAGGVHSYEDLKLLKELGEGRIHVTIGTALDLFGGALEFEKIVKMC